MKYIIVDYNDQYPYFCIRNNGLNFNEENFFDAYSNLMHLEKYAKNRSYLFRLNVARYLLKKSKKR